MMDEASPSGVGRSLPTLVDVAALAGVSLKTASRAINGESHVRSETRQRVLDAADALGFQPNTMASMLRRGIRPSFIGLITGDLDNPFYSALAKGVEAAVREPGMQLTIANSDEDAATELALVEELVARQVRGIVLVSTMSSHASLGFAQRRGIPIVFADRAAVDLTAPSVVLDNRNGTRTGVAHLLGFGHREIAFIGDYPKLTTFRERLAGFVDALSAHGIDVREGNVCDGAHDIAGARAATAQLLLREFPPTAIVASNNRIAIGVLYAIRDVGANVAVVGFDDFDFAELAGLTVISHDPVQMGREAAALVIGRPRGSAEDARQVVLPTTLIPRGSAEFGPAPR